MIEIKITEQDIKSIRYINNDNEVYFPFEDFSDEDLRWLSRHFYKSIDLVMDEIWALIESLGQDLLKQKGKDYE